MNTLDAASPTLDILGLIHRLGDQGIAQNRLLMAGKEILGIDFFRKKPGIVDFDAILEYRYLIAFGIGIIPVA